MKQYYLFLLFIIAIVGLSTTKTGAFTKGFFNAIPNGNVFLQRKVFDPNIIKFTFKVVNIAFHSIKVYSPQMITQKSTLHGVNLINNSCLQSSLSIGKICSLTFSSHIPHLNNPGVKQSFVAVYTILTSWNHLYFSREIRFGVTVHPVHAYIFYQQDTPPEKRIRICTIGYQGQLTGCRFNKPIFNSSATNVVTNVSVDPIHSRAYITATPQLNVVANALYICNINQSDGELTTCKLSDANWTVYPPISDKKRVKFLTYNTIFDPVHSQVYCMFSAADLNVYKVNQYTGDLNLTHSITADNSQTIIGYAPVGVNSSYSKLYASTTPGVLPCSISSTGLVSCDFTDIVKVPVSSPKLIALSQDNLAAYITKTYGDGPAIVQCPIDKNGHLQIPCKQTGYSGSDDQNPKLYPFSFPQSIAVVPNMSLVYIVDNVDKYPFVTVCQINKQNHALINCKGAGLNAGNGHPVTIAVY